MKKESNEQQPYQAKVSKRVELIHRHMEESFFSVKTMLKWLLIGTGIGLFVGGISTLFGHALLFARDYRLENPVVILGLPVVGIIIVFLYRFFKNSNDSGTNMVISSIHSSTDIPLKMAPLIFVSTILTQLCGGSAGREGAALQLGGSIANQVGKVIKLNEKDQHIIVMCGMSAAFSALFGTPMAAAIFALEVISIGIMHYSALVPCVTAAMIAHFVAGFFKLPPEKFEVAAIPSMDPAIFFKIIVFGALIGGVSIVFCISLHGMERIYKKYIKNKYIRVAVAGVIVIGLAALFGTDYLGTGMELIEDIFHTGEIKGYSFLLKIVFTAITLGAGFKGGEIVPSFCIGAAFGCAVAGLFGLPATLVAACGMVGLFCGVTNCPLTSLLISFELFGFEGMPYYLVTIAVSYMLSGYYGLYHAQKIMYSKTETNFVNKAAK